MEKYICDCGRSYSDLNGLDACRSGYHGEPIRSTESTGAELIAEERKRQIEQEGWTPENDDQHSSGQLADVACCYARQATAFRWLLEAYQDGIENYQSIEVPITWPENWHANWWKPKDPIRDLVRAGALIAAEIDRLKRLGVTNGS